MKVDVQMVAPLRIIQFSERRRKGNILTVLSAILKAGSTCMNCAGWLRTGWLTPSQSVRMRRVATRVLIG